jgi:Ferric reductase NAD binding domain
LPYSCPPIAKHKKTNFDLLLGHHSHYRAHLGRPNWAKELMSIKEHAKDELGHRECGVFLCGPEMMAEEVSMECTRQSKEERDFNFFFSKETF